MIRLTPPLGALALSLCAAGGARAQVPPGPATRPTPAAPAPRPPAAPAGTPTAPAAETRDAVVRRAYAAGAQRNPRVRPADPAGWQALARMSGLGYDDLVHGYGAVHTVAVAYKHLLGRQPDSAGAVPRLERLRGGAHWHQLWRELAQDPEREQRFGRWAPAPFDAPDQARAAFGLAAAPTPEQCFGALGDKCEGGIPPVYPSVQPRWVDLFTLPDGTQMGYVDVGVAAGSILHDNACFDDRSGLNCNGIGAGDLVKTSSQPAAMEWNKAAWNVLDGRTWRERFGPYPVPRDARRTGWYDDLRPAPAREAWMAEVTGMVASSRMTLRYAGGETRETVRLAAPAGGALDEKDAQFCRSRAFARVQTVMVKTWGNCR